MSEYQEVTKNLFIAPQISLEELEKIAAEGFFKSVINLRNEDEQSFMKAEKDLLVANGVEYHHTPLSPAGISEKSMDAILSVLDKAKKPTLVHCASAFRAGAVSLMHSYTRKGEVQHHLAKKLQEESGLNYEESQLFSSFIQDYVKGKLELISHLPELRKVNDELFVGPQPTESELEELAKTEGVKTVVNIRSIDEAGTLGLGVLSREEAIVKKLNMKYVNIPTKRGEVVDKETVEKIRQAIESSPKPVYLHCRTFKRTTQVLSDLSLKFE
mmetsp:Transcript_4599/g.5810  ORF Transcript_4599/g.5810 Transcript_4599/m.5810 type:complete len:271 (-) Transcript_4599:1787-2599(-)